MPTIRMPVRPCWPVAGSGSTNAWLTKSGHSSVAISMPAFRRFCSSCAVLVAKTAAAGQRDVAVRERKRGRDCVVERPRTRDAVGDPGGGIHPVERRERHVELVLREHLASVAARGVDAFHSRLRRREVSQNAQPPLADHPLRDFGDDAQHSGDAVVVVIHGAVRVRCGKSLRESRYALERAANLRPTSRCHARAPARCAAQCRARSPPKPCRNARRVPSRA